MNVKFNNASRSYRELGLDSKNINYINSLEHTVTDGGLASGGNGTFTGFSLRIHASERREVFFFGSTDATVAPGASRAGCIFRHDIDGTNATALLWNGDEVGLPGADTWIEIDQGDSLDVNGTGDLVLAGVYRDTMGSDLWSTFHLSATGASASRRPAGRRSSPREPRWVSPMRPASRHSSTRPAASRMSRPRWRSRSRAGTGRC